MLKYPNRKPWKALKGNWVFVLVLFLFFLLFAITEHIAVCWTQAETVDLDIASKLSESWRNSRTLIPRGPIWEEWRVEGVWQSWLASCLWKWQTKLTSVLKVWQSLWLTVIHSISLISILLWQLMSLWAVTKHKKPFYSPFWHGRHARSLAVFHEFRNGRINIPMKSYAVSKRGEKIASFAAWWTGDV